MGVCRLRERSAQRQRSHQSRAAPICTCTAASNPATSTSSSILRRIRLCSAWASPSCAILVSFLRFETKDPAGKANPFASAKKTAQHHPRLRLGTLAERTLSARLRLPRLQRRRAAPKSIRRHRAPRRRRRPAIYELRVRPAGHLVAATHQPARSGTISARLQHHQRRPDRPARRHSQTAENRPADFPHADFDGILAKARLSRPHRRQGQ